MRLIDADELSNVMYHQAFETDTDSQKWDSGCWIRYKMFENAITDAPTIDPVKHGRWDVVKTYHPNRTFKSTRTDEDEFCYSIIVTERYKCSICHTVYDYDYKFCPNCGAYMKGEQEEAD